jgi:hypothetical protein
MNKNENSSSERQYIIFSKLPCLSCHLFAHSFAALGPLLKGLVGIVFAKSLPTPFSIFSKLSWQTVGVQSAFLSTTVEGE